MVRGVRRRWHGPLALGGAAEGWAFTQSPCFLAIFDADLRLVRANSGMERALSLTEAEMRGLRLPEIAPDPVSDETERRMRVALESGEPQYMESFVHPTVGGADHGWATSVAPLRDPDGRVHAVCLAAHDRSAVESVQHQMLLTDEIDNAAAPIGTTLDSVRTAHELADAAVPRFADFAVVDLLEPLPRGDEPSSVPVDGPVTVCRAAARSILDGTPESQVAVGDTTSYPALSPPVEVLMAGRGAVYGAADPALARWAAEDPGAAWIGEYGAHSLMVVPMRAAGARWVWPSSAATGGGSPSGRRTCGWPGSSPPGRQPGSATRTGPAASTPPR